MKYIGSLMILAPIFYICYLYGDLTLLIPVFKNILIGVGGSLYIIFALWLIFKSNDPV